jgi:LEA14-like dessication related protein
MSPKANKILLFSGLGLFIGGILFYFRKQYQLIKKFSWQLLKVDMKGATLENLKGTIKFRFYNESDINITITQFYLDLYVNNQLVGYLEDYSELLIPSNNYNDLEFKFNLYPQFILKNIMEIVTKTTEQKDAKIGLKGIIKLKSGLIGAIPVEITCECSVKNLSCNCK